MEEILELWESLQKATEFKGNRLREECQQQQLNHSVGDVGSWLGDVEGKLMPKARLRTKFLNSFNLI
ncbi:hypothetical protein DPMN_155741 [Dreissena polymorpha]|uniref:Uncharacterized protein n=1 Tax=Dreissena polymorpha TaxID=45954 RepID=A0A9D4FNG2_DREPO|nr:hypothetical protein DPMN_155741 [Dreissena polymorpha]